MYNTSIGARPGTLSVFRKRKTNCLNTQVQYCYLDYLNLKEITYLLSSLFKSKSDSTVLSRTL